MQPFRGFLQTTAPSRTCSGSFVAAGVPQYGQIRQSGSSGVSHVAHGCLISVAQTGQKRKEGSLSAPHAGQ
jgi:hypothetical protein